MYIFIGLFIVALALIVPNIRIVPQSNAFVIERLGGYLTTWKVGLNLKIPLIDRVSSKVSLKEKVVDFPPQPVITKDNVTVAIDAVIYFQVIAPKSSIYEIVNYPIAIEKLTQTTLRNVIGELELDETLTSRDTINNKLQLILDEATDKWGIKVNRVELQDIIPPDDIKKQMEKQMGAEREKRAAILKAEGEKRSAILKAEGVKESLINEAEGDKQSAILRAQGEAKAIKAVREAFETQDNYAQYLIAVKYIDAFKEMTEGKDSKLIYMPYEASGVLSSIGGIKDLFVEKG